MSGIVPLKFFLFVLFGKTIAAPSLGNKISINLDISGDAPEQVGSLPSVEYPGAVNYFMKRTYYFSHVMGSISDAGEIILEDPQVTSRRVLVLTREDGTKYVKVSNRYKNFRGRSNRKIVEFIRRPVDFYYTQIFRAPLKLNVKTYDDDSFIKVENGETGKVFTIRDELKDELVIGAVNYGEYNINHDIEGLMERTVRVVEGRVVYIIIVSKYVNGIEFEMKYKFVDGRIPSLSRFSITVNILKLR
ncbi:signal peptide-containing protein [Theileria equi strain WA]|uniref:Signal peptide-containing protein n=1 Tax=Theileria equi strain WA TaxID=1537102 RepID=L0AWU3_THEEQ|nr:signal peptide-containing protein [Theileria equi strain WA]AFZ80020.1 signal peptide-containing protein [Theileria equi strain WA]|eukprot:XP_004829686.1 signal peptide-containing protein [Theileria equi strain WA]